MREKTRHYLDSLRLDRWPRSLAIIPGVVALYALNPALSSQNIPLILFKTALAFLLTWLVSTANYIINEITDAPYDAHHPDKKDRPLVKNLISRKILILIWFIMILVTFLLAVIFFNSIFFHLSLLALLIAGFIYNVKPIRVKDIPFLDSTIESANNPIRFLIGWFIFGQTFPPIMLLLSWWAFGNFLMIGKRTAEKKFLSEEESSGYRLSLRRYTFKSLIVFMVLNAIIFLVTFGLFAFYSKLNTLLYTLPFVIIYISMFFKKSLQDKEGAEEPEKLLKNPYFAIYTLFMAVAFLVAYLLK